jgi:hypothetical protein
MPAPLNLGDLVHGYRVFAPAGRLVWFLLTDRYEDPARFAQRVEGYEATFVAGTPIFESGEHTGAMPGWGAARIIETPG